jgi:hypothetical protein
MEQVVAITATKKKSIPWTYIALAVLGGCTLATGALLMTQWKHARLGRKVERDVLTFLKHYGSSVKGKVVSGGLLNVPLGVEDAITGTVNTMIKDVHTRVMAIKKAAPPKSGEDDSDEPQEGTAPMVTPSPKSGDGATPKAQRMKRGSAMVGGSKRIPSGEEGETGGPPEFPEPTISAKTGKVIKAMTGQVEETRIIGSLTRDTVDSREDDDDFSYKPPIPPGMRTGGAP